MKDVERGSMIKRVRNVITFFYTTIFILTWKTSIVIALLTFATKTYMHAECGTASGV